MENQYYLRIENDSFGFVLEGFHDIRETDVKISNEDYSKFFESQGTGKQFRIKQEINRELGLFGCVEEFQPEVVEVEQEPGMEEYLLDLEYRVSKIELGV